MGPETPFTTGAAEGVKVSVAILPFSGGGISNPVSDLWQNTCAEASNSINPAALQKRPPFYTFHRTYFLDWSSTHTALQTTHSLSPSSNATVRLRGCLFLQATKEAHCWGSNGKVILGAKHRTQTFFLKRFGQPTLLTPTSSRGRPPPHDIRIQKSEFVLLFLRLPDL